MQIGSQHHYEQRLVDPLAPFENVGEFELSKEVEQGRLLKSPRVLCPCREIFDRFSLTITRWLFTSTIRRSEPGKSHHSPGRALPYPPAPSLEGLQRPPGEYT